jgi:hypothetical protein
MPRGLWRTGRVDNPIADAGTLCIDPAHRIEPDVAVKLADVGEISASFDETTGWVRLSWTGAEPTLFVEFATNNVAGVADGELGTLYLRPTFESPN